MGDNETFVREHCPALELRQTRGRLRYMISLRCDDPESPMVEGNDLAECWRHAAAAVRRELGDVEK